MKVRTFQHEGITFEEVQAVPCKCPSCEANLFRSVGHIPSEANPLLLVCVNHDCPSDACLLGSSSTDSLEDARAKLERAVLIEENHKRQDRAEEEFAPYSDGAY